MKVSDLGRRTTSTPAYSVLNKEKQNKQNNEPFPKAQKFPDSQTLMGGPVYLNMRTKEEKAAYAKERLGQITSGLIETGKLWNEGRFHQ